MEEIIVKFEFLHEYACVSRQNRREYGRAYRLEDGTIAICLYDNTEPDELFISMEEAGKEYTLY